MPRLAANHLTKVYGQGALAVRALDQVSLSVEAGEVVGLLGPSGSGKSTLLSCLGLLDTAQSGEVSLDGVTIVRDGRFESDPTEVRRKRIGFVFQRANLVPFLDVRENVLLPLRLEGAPSRAAIAHADALLQRLDLWDRRGHDPSALSGGQRQRVALARALVTRPALVLADEPTAALDAARGREAIVALRELAQQESSAVLVVTHDTRIIDAFDRLLVMEDGKLSDGDVARTALAHATHAHPRPRETPPEPPPR
jgi:putative ABC transport system ATP-binding protein